MQGYVGVPTALHQLGGDDSHGAVVGGERLVQLRHGSANPRTLLHQVDVDARIGQVKGGLDSGDTAPDNYD
jgi:hypothetical protein